MKTRSTSFSRLVLPAVVISLVSCESGDPLADLEKEGAVYGGKPTTFTMQTDGVIRLKDLAVAGETIRVARKLNKSEVEILQLLAQKKFDGFMVTALEELRPKYDKKKQAVRQETVKRSSAIKAKVAAIEAKAGPAAPEAVAIRKQVDDEVAQINREEEQKIAMIDTEWHKEAAAKVRASYGTNFAVPVKASGGEAAVAFATLDDQGIARASDTAYALNTSPSVFLAAANLPRAAVTHQGKQSLIIASQPTF